MIFSDLKIYDWFEYGMFESQKKCLKISEKKFIQFEKKITKIMFSFEADYSRVIKIENPFLEEIEVHLKIPVRNQDTTDKQEYGYIFCSDKPDIESKKNTKNKELVTCGRCLRKIANGDHHYLDNLQAYIYKEDKK